MDGDSRDKKPLGRILLKRKLVSQDELDDLLQKQKSGSKQRLASGARDAGVSDTDLLKALSEQTGWPGIDLSQVVIPLENLELVPGDIAQQHFILPIVVKEDRIFLAMADPSDRRVIDEIEFVTGRRVFPYVALHDVLKETIETCYKRAQAKEPYFIGTTVPADYLKQLGLEVDAPTAIVSEEISLDDEEDALDRRLDNAFADEIEEEEVPSVRPPKRDKPLILVVDDEADIRKLLRRVLEQKQFDVSEAATGHTALELVRADPPDLILLDAMLPEVHGFDICRRLKGSEMYGHIPIIMVSAIYRGWRVAEDLRTSYGVDAFLEKPFKIAEVLSEVNRALAGGPPSPPQEEQEPSDEATRILEDGMEAYQDGNLELAIEKLQGGVKIDPLSFQLRYHLGLLYGRKEDLFAAVNELEIAVDLQPRHFAALKNLAVLYQRAGFKHKAIEMWERSLGSAEDEETREGIKEHLMGLL